METVRASTTRYCAQRTPRGHVNHPDPRPMRLSASCHVASFFQGTHRRECACRVAHARARELRGLATKLLELPLFLLHTPHLCQRRGSIQTTTTPAPQYELHGLWLHHILSQGTSARGEIGVEGGGYQHREVGRRGELGPFLEGDQRVASHELLKPSPAARSMW